MRRVIIMVFDGLQPAQVTPELMPNLTALAARGVTFANHHAVFPTVTRINAASMVTGRYPGGHGLAANTLVVRDFDPYRAFSALEPILAEVAHKTGRVLLAPTLGDILSEHGQEYIAVGTGTTGNAYVHNPNAHRSGGATIHPEFCLPYSLHDDILGRFGPWPEEATPNTERLSHAVRIMTEYILPERNPTVSLLWSCEPDHSQHALGVGSEGANAAIGQADEQFGRLLSWLEESGRADETDVMVVSDHGHSTNIGAIEVETMVREAGFPPGDSPGGVVVAPNGGSVLFYVHDRDRATADKLAAWLMAQPWCGAMTASDAVANVPGTLPAALLGGDGERAPELQVSFAWDSTPNQAGLTGHAHSAGGAPGLGMHGSMSRHEMHNILFAQGPSFKNGIVLDTPSGNTDLAPTILRILRISPGELMDGRNLEEALDGGPAQHSVARSTDVHEAQRPVDGGVYRQRITISRVGETVYVDEGRAGLCAAGD